MRVLVACEFSGTVRDAFAARGHDSWSCDILASGGGKHLKVDVLSILNDGWDLLIAHPPCTFLSSSGLHWNKRRPGRADDTEQALDFVRQLMASPIKRYAIENPVGCIGSRIRRAFMTIQPYEFGDDASKRTCLWLNGLMPLQKNPADRVPGRMVEWPPGSGKMVERWSNQTDSGQNKLSPTEDRWALRSLTYPGIAKAMAEQWG